MNDVILLAPELVLTVGALLLLMVARRIHRAEVGAAVAVAAAVGAAAASILVFRSGGPHTGFGGTMIVDGYVQFFNVLFCATLILAALLSIKHVNADRIRPGEFYCLLLLSTTGMMFAASAVDLLMVYLGLELMTLCSYVLVGITRERPASNEGSIKYFLLASFASAIFLYGISLSYGVTGGTDFATLAASARNIGGQPLLLAGVALVGVGLAFKIAAVPFHSWAPDAYQGASTPVAAFLAAGSKAAGLAALGRVGLIAFAPEQPVWTGMLVGLAGLSITAGSLLALSQSNMKRLLAYSSISHAGYALLGLLAGTPDGVSATMTYAFAYAFMTIGAFGIVVGLGTKGEDLAGYQGLAASSPGTAALMFIFLLSLTGIPPTAGFAAKFAVILSVVRTGHIGLAVLAVLCSVISAFFYLRVAVLMYMSDPQGSAPPRMPAAVSLAVVLAAVVTIVGGMFPSTFTAWTLPPTP